MAQGTANTKLASKQNMKCNREQIFFSGICPCCDAPSEGGRRDFLAIFTIAESATFC
jgi:hypothetical protein